MSNRQSFIWVFLLSLAVNLLQITFVLSPFEYTGSDMAGYLERAGRISAGEPLTPFDTFFPLGTAYVFAGFLRIIPAPLALQCLALAQCFVIATGNLFFGLSITRLFRSARLGLYSGIAAAMYWPLIARASFFLSEPFFMLFSLAGQYAAIRGVTGRSSGRWGILAGFCYAFALLIRSQGMCLIGAAVLGAPLIMRRRQAGRFVVGLLCPVVAVVMLQTAINQRTAGTTARYLSANDSFNILLGQSRSEGIATVDLESGEFHVFYNDNSRSDRLFAPVRIYAASILDRAFFARQVRELWRRDPMLQVFRSLINGCELWSVRASWPLTNNELLSSWELIWEWLAAFAVTLPALFAVIASCASGTARRLMIFLILPLGALTASSCISTGQPRFFLAMMHNLFPLALLTWHRVGCSYGRWNARVIRGAVLGVFTLFGGGAALMSAATVTVPPRRDGDERLKLAPAAAFPLGADVSVTCWTPLGEWPVEVATAFRGVVERCAVDAIGFEVGGRWEHRLISGAAQAPQEGQINVHLPAGRVSHIGVFLTDGDSFRRASLLRSDRQQIVAQGLHDGRWIVFPVTPNELRTAMKHIAITRLLGASVAVSGVAAFHQSVE